MQHVGSRGQCGARAPLARLAATLPIGRHSPVREILGGFLEPRDFFSGELATLAVNVVSLEIGFDNPKTRIKYLISKITPPHYRWQYIYIVSIYFVGVAELVRF